MNDNFNVFYLLMIFIFINVFLNKVYDNILMFKFDFLTNFYMLKIIVQFYNNISFSNYITWIKKAKLIQRRKRN
jgi:hypothetical protein